MERIYDEDSLQSLIIKFDTHHRLWAYKLQTAPYPSITIMNISQNISTFIRAHLDRAHSKYNAHLRLFFCVNPFYRTVTSICVANFLR